MEVSIIQIILVFIASTIIGIGSILDNFQTHRPLVACTLVGACLGDMTTGIMVGGALELLALGWANIGAAVAPDAALASVISVILVIVSGQSKETAISLAIPVATAGQVFSIILRSFMVSIQHGSDKAWKDGNFSWIDRYHTIGILIYSLRISIPTLLVLLSAETTGVQDAINSLPEVITGGLKVAGGFIVVVGYAMIMNMMKAGHLMPFFFLGFTTAAFTNFNLVGMGIIGLCLALLYISVHPKYNRVAGEGQAVASKVNYADNRLD